MDLNKINQFPYILDIWNELIENGGRDKKFLFDGVSTQGLTRGEIDDESSRVYAYLKEQGIGKEDFVMICLPRCVEVVPAMLGVLKAGAAFTIIDSHYSEERIDYIYNNCSCKIKIDLNLWGTIMDYEPLAGYEQTDPHDACFAVYTSGSTGNPKGVLHEYGNLKTIALTAIVPFKKIWYDEGDNCRLSLIPPLNFVAALKFIVYGLYTGYRIYIVPTDTIKNPVKLKKYYLENKITDSHLAPSVIRAAGNDFGPYLKRVITGSEPPNGISYENGELINNYTMSESSFVITQYSIKEKEEAVPVGVPNYDEIKIHLLDEDGNEVPDGEQGEICFENIYFRGYINMPDETKEAFRGGLFHTGDIGRKREDGNYVIVGRMNDMIKINGNRVEPAEIERQAKKILGINWCTVKGFVDKDNAFLCLYYTDDIEFDAIEAKRQFADVLPYYMVPSYFIKLDTIPLLPNNKIDKKALPKPDAANYRAEYVKPRNDLEKKLCEGFEKVLNIENAGIKDDFFELGGDSLKVMELLAYLDWGYLSSNDIYNGITVERIASFYMKRITAASVMSPEEYEMEARKVPHSLTPMQVYMLDSSLFKPKDVIWNMLSMFRIPDKNMIEKLRQAINKVIQHSPICSTMIDFDDDCELKQRYVPEKCPVLETEHVTDAEFEKIRHKLGVHTNVINSHLYIFRLFETESCGYLFMNRHHIATDGMSKSLLYKRIADAYMDKPLAMDTYYSTIQQWEDTTEQRDAASDEKYFLDRYGNVDWVHGLVHDHDFKEKHASYFPAPIEVTQDMVQNFEKNTGVTRNQLFNIGSLLALSKCTGSKNVLVSYTYHNRSDFSSDEALGGVYTSLPLGLQLDTFRNLTELYKEVASQTIGSIQHGDFNWFDLLFPSKLHEITAVTYETEQITESARSLEQIGLEEQNVPYSENHFFAQTLLNKVFDSPKGFYVIFLYQTNLYDKETIAHFIAVHNSFVKELLSIDNPSEITIEELMKRVN